MAETTAEWVAFESWASSQDRAWRGCSWLSVAWGAWQAGAAALREENARLQARAALAEPRWKPSDGDSVCQECGRMNPCWVTANRVWNEVIPDRVGVFCPICFIAKADPVLAVSGWELVPEYQRRSQPDPPQAGEPSQGSDLLTPDPPRCCPTCGQSDKFMRHPGVCGDPFHDDFLRHDQPAQEAK